jgi:hypothetical protein
LPAAEDRQRDTYEVALRGLLKRKLTLDPGTVAELLDWLGDATLDAWSSRHYPLAGIATAAEALAGTGPLADPVRDAIGRAITSLRADPRNAEGRKASDRLAALVTEGPVVRIDPGEAWSDAARADLEEMPPGRRAAWNALLALCQAASSARPSAKWLNEVRPKLDAVGRDDFRTRLLRWLSLVDRPRTVSIPRENQYEPDWNELIQPHHVDLLKGLAWCAALEADRDLARLLAALVLSAYRKVPGKGPRLVSLGNAAVAALGMMPGRDAVGQLALLKVKLKFIPAQKEVEKALTAAAERENLPREDLDELAMP